jgi:hypothetical protein
MKVLRITIPATQIAKQSGSEFQKKFTKKLLKAGFDLRDPITRQQRSDIEGADFIQFRYTVFDTYSAKVGFFLEEIKDWLIRNFTKNELEDEIENGESDKKD